MLNYLAIGSINLYKIVSITATCIPQNIEIDLLTHAIWKDIQVKNQNNI